MGLHSYNHGVVTSMKGVVREAFKVTIDGSGDAGTPEQLGANLIDSVAHNATGDYTVQLNKPYPPKLVKCTVDVAPASAALALKASYIADSYDSAAGTFDVAVTTLDGTPAAADPANGDEMMFDLVFGRYTTN